MQKYPTSSQNQSSENSKAQKIPSLGDMAFSILAKQSIFKVDIPETTSPKHQQEIASVLEQMIQTNLLPKFLLAVMDDKLDEVRAILDVNPEVLLFTPPANLIIESQLSHHQFYAEDALSMACKRKQLEMVKVILSCFNTLLEQANTDEEKRQAIIQIRANGLAAWKSYELHKNNQGEDEIVIPDEYAYYAQSLIDVFKQEDFPYGGQDNYNFTQLSEATEEKLRELFNTLLPEQAVKLDDYLDVELFLLATYKALYDNWYDGNFSYSQRSAFCARVIGLIQRALTPETAKIFCEGLYYVVERKMQISGRAKLLRDRDWEAFYPPAGVNFSSLGIVAARGHVAHRGCGLVYSAPGEPWALHAPLGKFMSNKNNRFQSITGELQGGNSQVNALQTQTLNL